MHKRKGSGLEPWPLRLTVAPPRLDEIGVSPDEFQKDTVSYLKLQDWATARCSCLRMQLIYQLPHTKRV